MGRPEKREKQYRHVGMKVSPEYKEWLQRFELGQRTQSSDLLDQGLALLAEARKFEPPPPR